MSVMNTQTVPTTNCVEARGKLDFFAQRYKDFLYMIV